MSDPVKICSAAAVLLGAKPVQSLEDDTDLSRIFANLYDRKKKALMSKYPWSFLMESRYLTRLAAAPIRGWKYAFVIPGDALAGAPHAVFSDVTRKLGKKEYKIEGKRVLCDSPELWGEFIINRTESEWPEYFQELMIHIIASDVALAVTDQQSIADHHYQVAYGTPSQEGNGGLMGMAMLLDSQSDGNDGIYADTFVDARRGNR